MTSKALELLGQIEDAAADFLMGRPSPCLCDLCVRRRAAIASVVALRAEIERLQADADRIDALEAEIKREPLLLHNCWESADWPRSPRGLGLIPQNPRTLRQAIDAIRATLNADPNAKEEIAREMEGRNG